MFPILNSLTVSLNAATYFALAADAPYRKGQYNGANPCLIYVAEE